MDRTSPSSMRVLIRPQSSATPTSSSPSLTLPIPSSTPPNPSLQPPNKPALSSQPSSQTRLSENIVVVGFIGRRPHDVTQLINRILDSNVFGSGNLHKGLCIEKDGLTEEVKNWFKCRQINYYHEEEKGILFLQFSSVRCPAMEEGFLDSPSSFDSAVEEWEFGDLQGMLFMFSVCHVIIYIQEGSCFDTQMLKKFRVLQAAKHALAPFARSQSTHSVTSRPPSSSSRPSVPTISSKNHSPGSNRGILSRNSSAISLMSGLGSYTSLLPGQCTPVSLFVFLDDFSDVPNPISNVEDSTNAVTLNQSSSLSNIARPSLPAKGSESVVVLARPVGKSEGGFRKKMQSSLEGQIRFLVKKCRTLTGSETSHTGSRSGGVPSTAPLFSLDASKAVVVLDRSSNQGGKSLEFAINLVEEVLNGKATSDTLLLESHGQSANKEDIQSVKEFIYRQSDILRGRGGLVPNANSGSAAGVGMVAVAAAAAAASAASGKAIMAPELPSLDIWLSSSRLLLNGILSAKHGYIDEAEISKRKSRQRNTIPPQVDGTAPRVADPLELAVYWLESGKGLNTKFSTQWCQRALPAARDVYLKDLPACYPTAQHEAHLEKALCAFHSTVKGPAVQLFAKKLEDECASIWRSGRQLCDAVSLTGKPCMHQRHDVGDGLPLGAEVKSHSSGFVFLHACACGRSRSLRSDPFNYETANITSSCFPNCDKLLPALQLPKVSSVGPIQTLSWSLIRVGGARYYEPSEGLLQSGFCATKKFLLKWTIFLEKQKKSRLIQQGSVLTSSTDSKFELNVDKKKSGAAPLYQDDLHSAVENKKNSSENVKLDDRKVSFGRGFPNFTMRKPFSEVVAGSAVADSEFPPLQLRKQHILNSEKGLKQTSVRDGNSEKVYATNGNPRSKKYEDISAVQETNEVIFGSNDYTHGDPFLQIGSNIVPVNMKSGENIKSETSSKHVMVYIGFEHECPHGHRFILTLDHLTESDFSSSSFQESQAPSSVENSDHKMGEPLKLAKDGGRGKVHQHSNGIATAAVNKVRNMDTSKESMANGLIQRSRSGKEQNLASSGVSMLPNPVNGLEESLQSVSLDDGGCAFSLINRNIPIYMNCPHCRTSKNKKDLPNIKFAGAVSQLQRIFLVTPPYPVVLATCPVIQFEASCLPPSILDREQKLQFSLGSQVILPPESFLTLRLPFIYGVQLEDRSLHPLKPFEHQPELTAWITKGTALQRLTCFNNSIQPKVDDVVLLVIGELNLGDKESFEISLLGATHQVQVGRWVLNALVGGDASCGAEICICVLMIILYEMGFCETLQGCSSFSCQERTPMVALIPS